MKTLTLELKKKILIIEYSSEQLMNNIIDSEKLRIDLDILTMGASVVTHNVICKGNELTEEICETLISKKDVAKNQSKMCSLNFKKGFISSIEAQGYYWGENPLGKEPKITEERYKAEREFMDNNPEESVFGDHYADWSMWKEAESKTFNLEKTLIFEIL